LVSPKFIFRLPGYNYIPYKNSNKSHQQKQAVPLFHKGKNTPISSFSAGDLCSEGAENKTPPSGR
jgi:hypothetical protein